MSGKKLPGLKAPNLNLGKSRSEGTPERTGTKYSKVLKKGRFQPYRPTYIYDITFPSNEYMKRTLNRLLLIDSAMFTINNRRYTGGQLELEKLTKLGKKGALKLTLKIPTPSGGTDIAVKKMLSLMNFEEELISVIYLDGSTDIRSSWSVKAEPCPLTLPTSGSQVMSIPEAGIPSLTEQQKKR